MFRMLMIVLTLFAAGCASLPGPRPVPPTPQPPPPAYIAMAVVLTDLESPATPVDGVRAECGPGSAGTTNADGWAEFLVPAGRQIDCAFEKPGWLTNTASFVPTPGDQTLETWLRRAPPPAPTHPDPLDGRLRLAHGCYADRSGCRVPIYAHAGDLFAIWVRDPERAARVLDVVAAAGYHGVRTWATLGCEGGECRPGEYWDGREVNPTLTPDYYDKVRAFFGALLERGLRAVWSQGDVRGLPNRQEAFERFARVDAGAVDWIDGGNEAWQTGEPDPQKLAAMVRWYANAGGLALKTLTDAPIYNTDRPPAETFNKYSIPPADAFDVHSGRGGHCYDKRRHAWSYTYEGPPDLDFGMNSEPPGGGARVSAIANRHEMVDECVALIALGSALGRMAHVWFSGEGVMIDKGLETEPGFWSVPRAMRLLPPDVMTFRQSHHSGDSWKATRVLRPEGEVRIDGRMADDGRFAYTIDGPAGSHRLRVDRGFTAKLCDPGTGACEDVARDAGQTLDVSFMYGRLLVGRVH